MKSGWNQPGSVVGHLVWASTGHVAQTQALVMAS